MRTCFGKTKTFEVKVGLHQGSALSPLLFIILLDNISKRCPMERTGSQHSRGITTSSRDVVQPTGSAWYADEQGKNGRTGSLERTDSATTTDYGGWTTTKANNSLQIPGKLVTGERRSG